MIHETWANYLSWASLIIGFVAAGVWIKAATVTVKQGDPRSTESVFIGGGGIDITATLREQGRWNARAAATTAIAIGAQAMALLIEQVPG